MDKQKRELTTAQLAEKKLYRIVLVIFIFSVMFGFKDLFSMGAAYLNILPNWWIMICLTLFACACILSLDLAEKRMKQMRQKIQKEAVELEQMRIQFQLIYSDLLDIKDPSMFLGYCVELLQGLGYQHVEIVPHLYDDEKYIVCYNGMGLKFLIGVKYNSPSRQVLREHIQNQYLSIVEQGASKGMFITTSDFSADALDYAQECNIQCINGVELVAMKQQAFMLNNTMNLAVLQGDSLG